MDLRRITAVADRLSIHSRDPNNISDIDEFFNLCLDLARGIEYIILSNEIPERFEYFPVILKQVYQCKNDPDLIASIFILMLSVKHACKFGYFLAKDSEELLALTNEIEVKFGMGEDKFLTGNDTLSIVTTIMSSFYPRLKIDEILTCIEVKHGSGIYMNDFFVQTTEYPPSHQIRLLVARTDLMENSSCLISPPQVEFLLNGVGVDKRTTLTWDKDPQMPTIVTPMLTQGVNFLRAMGEFNGNYIMIVAVMSPVSSASPIFLQAYDHSVVTSHVSDPETAEGESRISLNCPISFNRIDTPVKGQSCKHIQCFDFQNFMEMNAKIPSWRCPTCKQNIFLRDVRLDRIMVKILKEVNESSGDVITDKDGSWKPVYYITDVIISMDGSWKPVPEGNKLGNLVHSFQNLELELDANRKPRQLLPKT